MAVRYDYVTYLKDHFNEKKDFIEIVDVTEEK